MQIGNALEGTFLTRKKPVDRTILIHLFMVFPKVLLPILFDRLAEDAFYVVEILHLMLGTKHIAHKLGGAQTGIVGETAISSHEGKDTVIVYLDGMTMIGIRSQFLGRRFRVSNVQSGFTQAITSHPYTNSVGQHLFQHHIIVPYYFWGLIICFHHLFLFVCSPPNIHFYYFPYAR